jgi:hypothetical protein
MLREVYGCMAVPLSLDWRRVEVGVSIGECSMCRDSRPFDEMVRSNDKELYSCPEMHQLEYLERR